MNSQEYPERKDPKLGEKLVQGLIVGRDKKIIPQPEVEHLASLGCTDKDIAEWFGVSESTLRYNFSFELTKGRHQLKTSLRQAQLKTALTGNATLLIWLGKNILGQTDSPQSVDDKVLPWNDDDEKEELIEELNEELDNLNAAE
jgi:AraC-like DNA-binding protein